MAKVTIICTQCPSLAPITFEAGQDAIDFLMHHWDTENPHYKVVEVTEEDHEQS